MDGNTITEIASKIVDTLTPIFVGVGASAAIPLEKILDKLVKIAQEKGGEQIANLLELVIKKFQGSPVTEESLKDFIEKPEDEDTKASFRKELKKSLLNDEGFALQLISVFEKMSSKPLDKSTNVTQTGSGTLATHSSTIGGKGGITIGGSGHKIEGGIHNTDSSD